jgi:hypothetical protein
MQECNPPRNSRLQTHQDDEPRGGARRALASVFPKTPHRIDRFAHALKNSNLPLGATVLDVSARIFRVLLR